jgi:hypothetical protein
VATIRARSTDRVAERDVGMEKIAGERGRSKTRRDVTLPLHDLVREVLFDTVIVSGLRE